MDTQYPSKRSRSGCWTCRNRKKKCDGESFPCKNCVRLGLVCDRGTKLVWEDDARRKGMQRRGPRKTFPPGSGSKFICSTKQSKSSPDDGNSDHAKIDTSIHTAPNSDITTPIAPFDLCLSKGLTTHESFLLDHYIQRFSRIYPTFSGPTNPFLSILLPLAIQDQTVMSAVLALSGAQFEANRDADIARATLQARHRALEGCRKLVMSSRSLMDPNNVNSGKYPPGDVSSTNILFILACCICLLLYEKLVGDGKANWMPHLSFLAGLFDQLEIPKNAKILESIRRGDQQRQAFDFIHHLFLYNDLLQSTAQRKSTLSRFYLSPVTVFETVNETPNVEGMLQVPATQWQDSIKYGRFYYPYLVAQISAGEQTISDSCIDNWDGRLDWLPSFSLLGVRLSSQPMSSVENYWISGNDDGNANQTDRHHESIMISIYRNTAKIYLRQCLRRWRRAEMMSQCGLETVDLACHATFLISQLPDGSSFENALLWPIGIIGPELTATKASERQYLLDRLRALEHRFQMKHFERVREVLSRGWNRAPPANPMDAENNSTRNFDDDVFLFG